MYLSLLKVNIEGDPNLPRYGRTWLKNPYHVHQRLSRAFGEMPKDAHQNREPRADEGMHFLYRADASRIVVLSTVEPDWKRAFANASYLLAEGSTPETRPFTLPAEKGERLRFLLRANPTRKARTCLRDGRRVEIDARNGKRTVLVSDEERLLWLRRKGDCGGFSIVEDNDPDFGLQILDEGWVHAWKTRPEGTTHAGSHEDGRKTGSGLSFRSVRFSGVLIVTDPIALRNTIAAGLGPAKAFGFGLLSVARG
ncbi:MAG TPA: type I-E CRISPR-associated protein Cas6/Cse3/CasE [Planctomycetota bacterium]|jgi:CRISPR system Cascade subunit CasE